MCKDCRGSIEKFIEKHGLTICAASNPENTDNQDSYNRITGNNQPFRVIGKGCKQIRPAKTDNES